MGSYLTSRDLSMEVDYLDGSYLDIMGLFILMDGGSDMINK
jgi:hypothetical protein